MDSNRTSESSEDPDEQPPTDEERRAFLKGVRQAAGWRVSPRHIDVVLQALEEIGEEPEVQRIADVATAFHGEGSNRQKRNADLWRLLGAQLAVRGKPSDPEAQLAFIGRAKALADEDVSDSDLLLVATALGGANHPLTPEVAADATSWIIDQLGPDFDPGAMDERLDRAVEAAMAERAERANRRRRSRE